MNNDIIINKIEGIMERCLFLDKDENGGYTYKIEADYGDYICEDYIEKIFESENPRETFEDLIYEGFMDSEVTYEDDMKDWIEECWDDDKIAYDEIKDIVNDWITDNVSYIFPYDHYLKQDICMDILVDTGDANYDFVLNCVYPHYNGEYGETIDDKASIVWLTKQQGYKKSQLNSALRNSEYSNSKFLKSMEQEIANCTTHMNAITFFVKTTLDEGLKLAESIKKDREKDTCESYTRARESKGKGYITLNKDTPCGLYDCWLGAGSVLDIELEKDVKLPIKYVDSALPDGCRGYSISEIYGRSNDFWENTIEAVVVR